MQGEEKFFAGYIIPMVERSKIDHDNRGDVIVHDDQLICLSTSHQFPLAAISAALGSKTQHPVMVVGNYEATETIVGHSRLRITEVIVLSETNQIDTPAHI
jgi:hypothetical protein